MNHLSEHVPSDNQGYSLGVRLLKVVFSLYLVITLFITAVHMYNEFQQQKLRIDKTLLPISLYSADRLPRLGGTTTLNS